MYSLKKFCNTTNLNYICPMNIQTFINQYNPTASEILEFLECKGEVDLKRYEENWDEEELKSITLPEPDLSNPYQIMYDISTKEIEKLLEQEIKKAWEKPNFNLFETLGEITMCWEPIPSGVFDSRKAEELGLKIEKEMNSLPHAIKVLSEALEDPSYYIVWQANIAMAVYDELRNNHVLCCDRDSHRELIHEACNKGATNFLNLLIK